MAWVLPTGFEDPASRWRFEERSFDGDLSSRSDCLGYSLHIWSEELVFTFPEVYSDAVRLFFAPVADWIVYRIHMRGAVGQDIMEYVVNPPVNEWTVVGFTPRAVTEVRFAFRAKTWTSDFEGPAEIALRSVCVGLLAPLCKYFHVVGDFFIDLASDIRELWLVGEYLAVPFENLGDLFQDTFTVCCKASGLLQDILDALEGGITAEALLLLIQDHWPTLYYLITDPVDWFLVQLTRAFDLEPWNTQSLEFLAKWVLEEYFLTLYHIWLNPEDWLFILLEDRFPVLYYLITDPAGEILYLIGQAFDLTPYEAQSAEFIIKALFERWFPELYLLAYDPVRWLREHVLEIIEEITDDVGAFLENAWEWLLDKYEDSFEGIQARLYRLAEHTLRFFWEGEW